MFRYKILAQFPDVPGGYFVYGQAIGGLALRLEGPEPRPQLFFCLFCFLFSSSKAVIHGGSCLNLCLVAFCFVTSFVLCY